MPRSFVLALLASALLLSTPCVSAEPSANSYENPSDPNCHCSKADYNRIGPSHLPFQSPGKYYTRFPRNSLCNLPPLKRLVSYRVARAEILASGYKPAYSTTRLDNTPCDEKDPRFPDYAAQCKSFPEVESCAVEGVCYVYFRDDAGNRLGVVTFGPDFLRKSEVAGWGVRCAKH